MRSPGKTDAQTVAVFVILSGIVALVLGNIFGGAAMVSQGNPTAFTTMGPADGDSPGFKIEHDRGDAINSSRMAVYISFNVTGDNSDIHTVGREAVQGGQYVKSISMPADDFSEGDTIEIQLTQNTTSYDRVSVKLGVCSSASCRSSYPLDSGTVPL